MFFICLLIIMYYSSVVGEEFKLLNVIEYRLVIVLFYSNKF